MSLGFVPRIVLSVIFLIMLCAISNVNYNTTRDPQAICVCLVIQICLTLCDSMDCRLPGSSVHGIFQDWKMEWTAIFLSRGSS